jgi:hypothetical protein
MGKKLDELSMFQPIMTLFFQDMLSSLRSSTVVGASASSSAHTTNISKIGSINNVRLTCSIQCFVGEQDVSTVTLSGFSDIGFHHEPSDFNIYLASIVELKSPLTHLYQQNAAQPNGQLIGELLALRLDIDVDTGDVFTIGALTDLFAVQMAMMTDSTCYKGQFVTDPTQCIKYFLMLFLEQSSDALEALLAASQQVEVVNRRLLDYLSSSSADLGRNNLNQATEGASRKRCAADNDDQYGTKRTIDLKAFEVEENYWEMVDYIMELERSRESKSSFGHGLNAYLLGKLSA